MLSEQDLKLARLSEELQQPGFFRGLSGRLLRLAFIAVMVAEVAIFVPSVANMRVNWLKGRLSTAAVASIVVDGLGQSDLPVSLRDDTLMATGVKVIVLERDGTRRLIAATDMPPGIDRQYDLSIMEPLTFIKDAFDELVFGGDRIIRVYGPVEGEHMTIDIVMSDASLRNAMLTFSRNVFLLSLGISLFAGLLIFFAINRSMVNPIRRLTQSMHRFSDNPEDPAAIWRPTGVGKDELAVAGRYLASMQTELQKTLKSQRKLAELGLAVSKINHDMRNILASAQLISDRLGDVDDPMVKRLAPKLLRAIDRAVGYSNSVISYGKYSESEPNRRLLPLSPLIHDVYEGLGLEPDGEIICEMRIQEELQVDADPEQLFRAIHNLCRNAVQALDSEAAREMDGVRQLTVSAHRSGSVVAISVDDTGPGMPQKARENLFSAFKGSVRAGGAGLGLAIARELVLAHGGTIALVEKAQAGTLFKIEIPDRPAALAVKDSGAARAAGE